MILLPGVKNLITMDLKYPSFLVYMNSPLGEIPADHLREMMIELMGNAIYVMSTSDIDDLSRMYETMKDMMLSDHTFRLFPLALVVEIFHKGSLGELGGTSKFGIRNVHIWMNAAREKFMRMAAEEKSKEDFRRRSEEAKSFKQLQARSSLYAAAFYWKISHCPMGDAEYDRLTLDKIVDAFRRGYKPHELTPSMIL